MEDGSEDTANQAQEVQPGDHIAWNTSQGETTGFVRKRLTERTTIRAHDVAASPSGCQPCSRPDGRTWSPPARGQRISPYPARGRSKQGTPLRDE